MIALVVIGLPFVVRTVEPVLADASQEVEEAAVMLGDHRAPIFARVILPAIAPAVATGQALAFARGAGEYSSIIFISGNMLLAAQADMVKRAPSGNARRSVVVDCVRRYLRRGDAFYCP